MGFGGGGGGAGTPIQTTSGWGVRQPYTQTSSGGGGSWSGWGGRVSNMLSMGLKTYGAISSGRGAQGASNYNADVALQEGEMAQKSAQMRKWQITRQKGKMAGRQHALYAKAGVVANTGSPFEVMVDTAAQYELDKAITQYNADVMSARAKSESDYRRQIGKNYNSSGWAQAGNILLSGLAKEL